jgi:hypothetical protein
MRTYKTLPLLLILGALAGGTGIGVTAPAAMAVHSKQPSGGKTVTNSKSPHVTVTYGAVMEIDEWHPERNIAYESTATYAVTTDIMRELSLAKLTGNALYNWLENKGCQLDREDGPALVTKGDNGESAVAYYRNGEKHRVDGPAYVGHDGKGHTDVDYYRDGKLDRADGPASVRTLPDGSSIEKYYRDGKKHRPDGPAETWYRADGSKEWERYFLDGVEHNKAEYNQRKADYQSNNKRPPAPNTPDKPGAPGPT